MTTIFTFLIPLIFVQSLIYSQKISEIESILDKVPSKTKSSIFIYNPNTMDTIYNSNIQESMIPASNTKLFTAAAALNLMEYDHEFKTSILSEDFDYVDSVINGNLYIKGYGNSVFTEKDLDSLVDQIYNLGVREITGNIIGDDSFFDDIYTRDDWITGERANVNLSPISALVINRNKMLLTLNSNKSVGSKLGYSLKPYTPFNNVIMEAVVKNKRSRPSISTNFDSKGISIKVGRGIRKSKRPKLYAIFAEEPALFASFLLYGKLQNKNIKIGGNCGKGITPIDAFEINKSSSSLIEILEKVNKNSDNYLAECLFKAIGSYYSGEQGNSFYATQAVLTYLDEQDIYSEGTAVVDGSGISRFNEVTTAAIIGLLENLYFNEIVFDKFYNSLSIAGIDGTLSDRFLYTPVRNNFRGKTGTLNGVTSLSGYLTTKNNEDLIISIIMEYKTKGGRFHKDIQDKLILHLYNNF